MPADSDHHDTAVFTCPHCADPGAQTVESDLDIHSGAIYTCNECGGKVIFEAMTAEKYSAYCNWLAAEWKKKNAKS